MELMLGKVLVVQILKGVPIGGHLGQFWHGVRQWEWMKKMSATFGQNRIVESAKLVCKDRNDRSHIVEMPEERREKLAICNGMEEQKHEKSSGTARVSQTT